MPQNKSWSRTEEETKLKHLYFHYVIILNYVKTIPQTTWVIQSIYDIRILNSKHKYFFPKKYKNVYHSIFFFISSLPNLTEPIQECSVRMANSSWTISADKLQISCFGVVWLLFNFLTTCQNKISLCLKC